MYIIEKLDLKQMKNYIKNIALFYNRNSVRQAVSNAGQTTKKNFNLGFTLIELLVVISIIALLASVVLVALNGARQKARDAKRVADMNQMAKAMELFYQDNNSYPTYSSAVTFSTDPALGSPSIWPRYMTNLPNPPTPADGSCDSREGASAVPGGNDYYFYSTGSANTTNAYTITFCLGNRTGTLDSGPHTLSQTGIR